MLLQIVSHTRNVCRNLHTIREANTGDLTNSGVWLPRGLGGYLRADTALEGRRIVGRAILQGIKTTRKSEHARLA